MQPASIHSRAGKYVTFQLSRHYFAIRSECVRQILPLADVRGTTQRAPFLYGAAGTNGRLIPVLDVRERLALNARPPRPNGSVLVIVPDGSCPLMSVGLVVDKLNDVVDIRENEIRGNVAQVRVGGRPYGRPKTVLEVEGLLDPREWEAIRQALL